MSDRQISPTTKLLITAKERINSPDKWCQGMISDESFDLAKGRVCALGALLYASGVLDNCNSMEADKAMTRASKELFGHQYIRVNDNIGYEAVMRVFDRAISLSMQDDAKCG